MSVRPAAGTNLDRLLMQAVVALVRIGLTRREPAGVVRLPLRAAAGYRPFVMRRSRSSFRPTFSRPLRTFAAFVTLAQLLVVAAAPLADRPSSSVAAVHVEQAGTRLHHSHGDLCATCVALHLLWTPPREPAAPFIALVHVGPRTDQSAALSRAGIGVALARAPPA